jgi:hypothetical protein
MSASGELAVYVSFLKDSLYAASVVFLLWLSHWPTYPYFFAHIASWVAFFCYYTSTNDSFWAPTAAMALTLAIAAVDGLALLNTVCYLPSVGCCLTHRDKESPFTLGQQVCGANDRYDPPTLTWLAISVVGMGIFTAVARVVGIYGTRAGGSLEMALTLLYVLLKAYLLAWSGIVYTAIFWTLTVITMCLHISGVLVSFKLPFVAVLLFLASAVVDAIVMLGATKAVSFYKTTGSTLAIAQTAVPAAVRIVWSTLHAVFLAVTVFEMYGVLTRDIKNLPGPYRRQDASKKDEAAEEDDTPPEEADAAADEAGEEKQATTGAPRAYSGFRVPYAGPARRALPPYGSERYI